MNESAAGAAPQPWLRFGGIVAALAICSVAQWYIAHKLRWSEANVALVAGALAAALLLGRPEESYAGVDATPARRPTAISMLGLIAAALGFIEFLWAIYLLSAAWIANFDRGAPLALLGVALCSAGLAVWDGRRRQQAGKVPMPLWELALFLAIVALAFFLRFYRYDYFPPDGVCAVEEPQSGQGAYTILYEHTRPWEFVFDRWLPIPFFLLMGRSMTALRLPFTLVSALTVIPLYLLLRQLVSRPAALFAAALFAMCRWHLMYARLAHAVFPTTLIVVLIFYLCVRVHRRGGLGAYVWIGFLTAYTMYAYAGYRGTPMFVAIFFALSLFLHWRARRGARDEPTRVATRQILTAELTGLTVAAVIFAGTVTPLALRLRDNPTYYFEAANRSLVNKSYYTDDVRAFIAQRLDRLGWTAKMFNHVGDGSESFNLPGVPQLDPFTGLLFTIALAYCVIWGRYRFQGFFALTFLVLLIMGTTFVQNFDIRRLQVIIPFIFILIAFLVDRLNQIAVAQFRNRGRVVFIGAWIVVGALALRDNYIVYVEKMMNDPRVRISFQTRYTVAIRYLHSLPSNAYMLFLTDALNFFDPSDYQWLRGDDVPGKATSDLLPLFNGRPGPWTGRDLRILIQDVYERNEIVGLIRQRFPTAQCAPWIHPDKPPYLEMTACKMPSDSTGDGFHGGIRARYFRDDQGDPFLERLEPALSYAFLPDDCQYPRALDKPLCRAEWEGTFQVPEDGAYQFMANVRQGELTVTVDDQVVPVLLQLKAGPHVARARARFHSIDEAGARLWWRPAGTEDWHLVPFATFDGAAPSS